MKSKPLHDRMHSIVFESNTKAGRYFDYTVIFVIICSILLVMLESVSEYHAEYLWHFHIAEWFITVLFTLEYILRVYAARDKPSYIFSFYGLIDLFAILPLFLTLFYPEFNYLTTIQGLRLLRVFRILKLNRYFKESRFLMKAIYASRIKVTLFLSSVLTIVVLIGALMYYIEGHTNEGFRNIPMSMYWAVVTLTTVGYGDIIPVTAIGKLLAGMLMILGYSIIAVPTGIVTAEMTSLVATEFKSIKCRNCGLASHDDDAVYCKHCGSAI